MEISFIFLCSHFKIKLRAVFRGNVIWLYFPWELDSISFLKNDYILMTEKGNLTNCSENNIPLEKVCLIKLWCPSINSLLHFFQIFWSLGKKNLWSKQNWNIERRKSSLPDIKTMAFMISGFCPIFYCGLFFMYKIYLELLFLQQKSSYSICIHVETEKRFC